MTTKPDKEQNQDYSTCANPPCNCPVEKGQTYCCEGCESQSNSEACQCGHSQCQAE
jgi:hypothetical protein